MHPPLLGCFGVILMDFRPQGSGVRPTPSPPMRHRRPRQILHGLKAAQDDAVGAGRTRAYAPYGVGGRFCSQLRKSFPTGPTGARQSMNVGKGTPCISMIYNTFRKHRVMFMLAWRVH